MGYSHHDAISVTGTGGFAVGSKVDGETRIIDSSGNISDGNGIQQNVSQGVMSLAQQTDGGTGWHIAPYDCDVTGYVCLSVSSGTGRVVSVAHGSVGDDLMAWSGGTTGTIGVVIALTASAVPSLTAQEPFRLVVGTCATAQLSSVTLVLTKT